MFALLGPNGAGKTTTVRILATLLAPDGGTARVAGHDVTRDPNAVRAAISLTAQEAAVDGMLTGAENLRMMARLRGVTKTVADELLERFDLVEAAGSPGRAVQRRHAAPARPGDEPRGQAPGAVPGRAHDRPGPAQPARRVGGRPGPRATTA